MERPARLAGGCHGAAEETGGQPCVAQFEGPSFVPSSCCAGEPLKGSCPLSQTEPGQPSLHVLALFVFDVLGGKMGQERLCLVFDSSIGLSLYISEL